MKIILKLVKTARLLFRLVIIGECLDMTAALGLSQFDKLDMDHSVKKATCIGFMCKTEKN